MKTIVSIAAPCTCIICGIAVIILHPAIFAINVAGLLGIYWANK
jgi:hypothetical protein